MEAPEQKKRKDIALKSQKNENTEDIEVSQVSKFHRSQRRILLPAGACDQPVQHGVEIGLFFGADAIAADLAVGDGFEVHGFDQLIDRQFDREIGLVAQYQEWDAIQGGLVHQLVQFFRGHGQCGLISCVYDISDCKA